LTQALIQQVQQDFPLPPFTTENHTPLWNGNTEEPLLFP